MQHRVQPGDASCAARYPCSPYAKTEKTKKNLLYITGKFSVVFGLVLIWRGIWELLDAVDVWMFQGSHIWTALIGILVGMAILYLPDRDLKEIDQH